MKRKLNPVSAIFFTLALAALLCLSAVPALAESHEHVRRDAKTDEAYHDDDHDLDEDEIMEMREELAALTLEAQGYTPAVKEFYKKEMPEVMDYLKGMAIDAKKPGFSLEDKIEYQEALIFLGETAIELNDIREDMPSLYPRVREKMRLEISSMAKARHFRNAPAENKKVIREELRKILEKSFKINMEIRALEADRIEKELREIRSMLDQRKKNREIIIQRRLDELTQGEDPYEW